MSTMYEVWAKTDERGRVLALDGGVTMVNVDTATWTKIDEGDDTERYGGCQQHYVDMPLYTDDYVPRYKLVDNEVVLRDDDEIENDLAAMAAEEARKEAEEAAEKQRPFNELQEQIDEQTDILDDVILMMADIIGGV